MGIDSYVILMLHGNDSDGSTTFTDDSLSAHGNGVATGNVQIDTDQSKFGGSSIYFDGVGDYITYADSADWDWGTGDFTVDCWVRFTNVSVPNVIIARTTSGSSYFYWQLQNGTSRFADYNSGYAVDFNVAPTLAIDTWYHVAITRKGSSFRMFLNGTQVGSTYTSSNSMNDRSVGLDVGMMTQNAAYVMHGWIDELRISKGIARWTTNFTVPSAEYETPTTSNGIDSYTKLNLHGDYTSPVNTDSGAVTASSGSNPGYAVDFTGATAWYSSSGVPQYVTYDFGTGVTIYRTSFLPIDSYRINAFNIQGSNNGTDWDTLLSTSHPDNLEEDVFTLSSTGSYRYYRFNITSKWGSGNVAMSKWKLYSNVTTDFTDSSPEGHTLTAYGSAQTKDDQSKFGGGSMYFDGNGDYLQSADSADWGFGTGDFTIDGWVRRNGSQADFSGLIGASNTSLVGWELSWGYSAGSSSNKLRLTSSASGSWTGNMNDPDIVPDTTWTHFALVRYGNILTLYVNGIGKVSISCSGYNFVSGGQGLTVGKARVAYSGLYSKNWLDELRVSKGIARWTENFDVPTSAYAPDGEVTSPDVVIGTGSVEAPTILNDWTQLPSVVVGTGTVQTPVVQIQQNMSVTPDVLIGTGSVQTPTYIGGLVIVSPDVLQAIGTLYAPDIFISSKVLPTTLVATGSVQSPSYPGLNALKNVKKIISFNPLVVVTDTSPLKIGRVDTTDPNNPVTTVYELTGVSGAYDIHYDSIFGKIFIACDDGKIAVVDASDFNTYTVYDTGVTTNLRKITNLPGYEMTFASTDDADGEIVVMDDSVKSLLSMDIRFVQAVSKFLACQVNTVHGAMMNLDLRYSALVQAALGIDVRFNQFAPEDYVEPISRLDFVVYINGVEAPDVKMDAINIYHSDSEKSRATFQLARQHDNLDYTLDGVYSQITNQNTVRIEIDGHVEFEGNIWEIDANSEQETVNVTAYSSEAQSDERSLVTFSLPSVNEQLNLYHALVHNPRIENPYVLADDPNPPVFKGIFVPAGYDEKQNVSRWSSFQNSATVAESVTDGTFVPKQNWTYFWFATARNFITGVEWATLNYIGTSPTGLTGDTWEITGMAYKFQRKFDSKKTRLGTGIVYAEDFRYQYDSAGDCQRMYNSLKPHGYITYDGTTIESYASQPAVYAIMSEKIGYRVGSAPYKSVSCKAGRLVVADQWEDKPDGMYVHRDEAYDYRSFALAIANLELRKIQNINGQVLPKTSADVEIFLDAYYNFNVRLLKRINIDNTVRSGIYKNSNGFPVSVKSIDISSANMKVTLRCDNQWSRLEQLEIEGSYPIADDYVTPAEDSLLFSKFDPRTLGEVE